MKKQLIKIILVASLAFNLAFIGTAISRGIKNNKDEKQQVSSFADQYQLNQQQKRKLDEIVQKFRVKLADNKSDVLEKRIDIIELLGDPEFKAETLDEKLLELNDIEKELNAEFISTLMEIGTVLEQGQWIKFLYDISRGWFFS